MPLERVWPEPPPIYASIAGEPAAVLAEFPMPTAPLAYFFDTRYLYFSTFHWHPHRQRQQRLLPEVVRRADRARAGLSVGCGRRVPAQPRRRLRRGPRRVHRTRQVQRVSWTTLDGPARTCRSWSPPRGKAASRGFTGFDRGGSGLGLRREAGRPEPEPAPTSVLDAGNERPDPRDVHLFNRDRLQIGLRQECGRDRDRT